MSSKRVVFAVLALSAATAVSSGFGWMQNAGLFFREDWKETPAELPVTQSHVANPDLLMFLYGPGSSGIKKSNHPNVPNDPFYIWSGECRANWAVGLKHRSSDVDLTGPEARIRWRSKQAGFRQLRAILRLADGEWIISSASDGEAPDWRVYEMKISETGWRTLDISRVVEGKKVEFPSLGRVQEIGFTDLAPGGSSDACSRLDWIEVYGKPAPRQ